jgi:hypothetical protein
MKRNPTALDLCIARAYMLYPYPQDRSLRDPQPRRCVLLLYRQQVGTLPAVVTPIMHSRYQVDKLMSADGKTAATRVRVYMRLGSADTALPGHSVAGAGPCAVQRARGSWMCGILDCMGYSGM